MLTKNIKLIKGIFLSKNAELILNSAVYDFVVTFNGRTHIENHGTIINLYPQNEIDDIVIEDNLYYLFFNKELIKTELEDFLNQGSGRLSIHLSYIESMHLAKLAESLISIFFNKREELSLLFVHNIIEQVILMMMLKLESPKEVDFTHAKDKSKETAYSFLELVKNHLLTEKKVAVYSEKLGVTEKLLTRYTKETFNCTPKELIHREIMEAAKALLSQSDLPIKEISFQLGFEEENNFSAFFKKHLGHPPKAYRKVFNSRTT